MMDETLKDLVHGNPISDEKRRELTLLVDEGWLELKRITQAAWERKVVKERWAEWGQRRRQAELERAGPETDETADMAD